jgi:release factor glutamine methyltransferase
MINPYLSAMEFPEITIDRLIRNYRQELKHLYDGNEAMQFIYMLFESWFGWSKARVQMERNRTLTSIESARFEDALRNLRNSVPIQYLTGVVEFNGVKLRVNPSVLIPRPETEEMMMLVTRTISSEQTVEPRILDVGTGSGCVAISLKKSFPQSVMTAIDISDEALQVAAGNARNNRCDIRFLRMDFLDRGAREQLGSFDLIISNPPYVTVSERLQIKRNVLEHEPGLALFVPDNDPLIFYSAIAEFASAHLKSRGTLYTEINERFGNEVRELLNVYGFLNPEILDDFNGKPRFAKASRH